jgi:hypothetical protein
MHEFLLFLIKTLSYYLKSSPCITRTIITSKMYNVDYVKTKSA